MKLKVTALLTGVYMIGTLANAPLSLAATRTQTGSGARTLYYGPHVMERVMRCHMTRGCGDSGDYVPAMKMRPGVNCLTAVDWAHRSWVFQNKILVLDIWDRIKHKYERFNCLAVDWQMYKDRTPYERFEIDWRTALAANVAPWNSVSRLVAVR